ncbi:choline transporter-like 2 isoform X2 [Culicoides brevitarsis]|uniref:choline transporter-like 2 isoform X2 n=1 Tax=Culicoides brevitarsis TaxID=469753 RepID=UPI00307BA6EC
MSGGLETRPEGVFDESTRKPTDRFWLIPFVVAVIAFFVVTGLAGSSGSLKGLANNRRNLTDGPTCGFDSNVLDLPYVLYVDERDCARKNRSLSECKEPWICVKECPKGLFDVTSCTSSNFPVLKENMLCQSESVKKSVINCDTMSKAVQLNKCAAYFNGTEELFDYCHSLGVKEVPAGDESSMEFEVELGSLFKRVAPSFLLAILVAIVVSFFFIITLKWSAAFVFWGFASLVLALIAVMIISFGVVLGSAAQHAKTQQEADEVKKGLYMYCAIFGLMFLAFVALLYFFRKKIRCGIEIVKESSRAVTCSYASVFFPLLPFLIRAVIGLTLIFGVIMLAMTRSNVYSVSGSLSSSDCVCNATYNVGGSCLPEKFNKDCHSSTGEICEVAVCQLDEQAVPATNGPFIIILLFCGMWIVSFVQANTKMVLAHVYGNWYWNWNQEFIPSGAVCTAMGKIFGNHMGTAALGSLIITLCRLLKSLLERRDRNRGEGMAAMIMYIIGECVRFCAQALLTLIEFVSAKAFVVCAIMGTTFWGSVKGVSQVMLKDIPLVVATEYVGDIILFVCKFVAALASAGLFYALAPFTDDEHFIIVIFAIIIFIFAYDLASVLLTAYDVAIDTILVCGLQDYLHNKAEKAYFQSETLNELLLQKNTA